MAKVHLAVLGSPIEHSKSPVIHSRAYEFLALDWDYGRYRVEANELAGFLRLRDNSWRGLSLTMPLKEVAASLSTLSCPVARETGVVNTLLHTENGWEGYNTDSFGISQAISRHTSQTFEEVNILGSGATATSAINAAGFLFPNAQINLFARQSVTLGGHATRPLAHFFDSAITGLTISTLPGTVHMPPLSVDLESVILDVAYDPWPSSLASNWLAPNRISGLEMLLWQALVQVRIFVSGDGAILLPDEVELFSEMSQALKS